MEPLKNAEEPTPLNNEGMIRPRLSKLEVQVIVYGLNLLTKQIEGSNEKAWIKRLSERFEHIQRGSKFLRPRRGKA